MLNQSKQIISELVSEKDYSFLVLGLSICLLPISINLSTFTFIAALALKILQVVFKKAPLFETTGLKHSAIIGLVFFSYIQISSIYQAGLEFHLSHFEKLYMHFAMFFLTPMVLKRKRQNTLLIYALFLGLLIAVLYIFFYALINGITFDKFAFVDIIDIHHTYLSLYILTFVNYGAVYVISNKNVQSVRDKAIFATLGLIALFVMFLLDSKVGMLIFLILFIVHSLPELSRKNLWYYVSFLVITLTVLTVFTNKVNVSYESALDFRLQIWEVAFKEFESNPMVGNLTLPEKDILNYHHYINGKYYYLDSDLNSHNQYLSILMRFGVLGFVILFFYMVNIFRKTNPKTLKIDTKAFFGFLIIIMIACYIENILDRHHGIVYLTIFYNYYLVAIENADA